MVIVKISNHLEKWVNAGLISSDQQAKILDYENQNQSRYAYYGFLGLGAIAIAIGIISVIAFNWNHISDGVKLGADFVLLCLLGGGIFVSFRAQKLAITQILNVVFFGFILGSIGLISQIFHTGGELYQALTLFLILTLPLMLILGKRLAVHLWYLIAVVAVIDYWSSFLSTVFILVPAIFATISLGFGLIKRFEVHSKAAMPWAVVFYAIGTIVASGSILSEGDEAQLQTQLIALFSFVVPVALSFLYFRSQQRPIFKSIIFLVLALLFYTVFLWPQFAKVVASDFILALMFIIIWICFAFFALTIEQRRLFELCLIGVGIRFLVVYFQILGDLAITGFGLILSGLIILGCVWVYAKYRESIMKGLSRWI